MCIGKSGWLLCHSAKRVYASRDLQSFCYTHQGQTNPLVNSGATEQRLIITRGRYGCLDGSLRSIMKYWAIVVGKRNEHQRGTSGFTRAIYSKNVECSNFIYSLHAGDRERYIRVHQENVVIKAGINIDGSVHFVLLRDDSFSFHRTPTAYTIQVKPTGLSVHTTFVPSPTISHRTTPRRGQSLSTS